MSQVSACLGDPGQFYVCGKGREVGLGWGYKVDGHMPWGALSGSCLMLGRKRVFWGRGGGFCAAVAQYLRYMQTDMHTHTCIYILIPAHIQSHTAVNY
jgi:hypothetical protein